MPEYKVIWTEIHEQTITARDEEQAAMFAGTDSDCPSRKSLSIDSVEFERKEEPEDFDINR
jgi:hypothetical protein